MHQRIKRLADRIDDLDTLPREDANHLVVHGVNTGHKLHQVLVVPAGCGCVIARALHVIQHGEQSQHELLGRTLLLCEALGSRALAVVVPVSLQAGQTLGSVGSLLLSGIHGILRLRKLCQQVTGLLARTLGVGLEVCLCSGLTGALGSLYHGFLVELIHGLDDILGLLRLRRDVVYLLFVLLGREALTIGHGHLHVTLLLSTKGAATAGRPFNTHTLQWVTPRY